MKKCLDFLNSDKLFKNLWILSLHWAEVDGCFFAGRLVVSDKSLFFVTMGRTNGSGMINGGKMLPYAWAAFLQ